MNLFNKDYIKKKGTNKELLEIINEFFEQLKLAVDENEKSDFSFRIKSNVLDKENADLELIESAIIKKMESANFKEYYLNIEKHSVEDDNTYTEESYLITVDWLHCKFLMPLSYRSHVTIVRDIFENIEKANSIELNEVNIPIVSPMFEDELSTVNILEETFNALGFEVEIHEAKEITSQFKQLLTFPIRKGKSNYILTIKW